MNKAISIKFAIPTRKPSSTLNTYQLTCLNAHNKKFYPRVKAKSPEAAIDYAVTMRKIPRERIVEVVVFDVGVEED